MQYRVDRDQAISFPVVWWSETQATFICAAQLLPVQMELLASLVFAISGNGFVVADIIGRGWCIPGGHLFPGETPEDSARREAHEEAGIVLGDLHLLGHFVLRNSETGINQIVPTYVSEVTEFGVLPQGTESRGIRVMSFEELPENYFIWDVLMNSIFHYALDQFNRIDSSSSPDPLSQAFGSGKNHS